MGPEVALRQVQCLRSTTVCRRCANNGRSCHIAYDLKVVNVLVIVLVTGGSTGHNRKATSHAQDNQGTVGVRSARDCKQRSEMRAS